MSRPIVFLSTYPPRRCGIATFTHDLRSAVGSGRVYALGPLDGGPPETGPFDPPEVMAFLLGHDAAAYRHAAIAIDGLDPAAVSLQHEFGIYGGPDGANVLAFADRLRAPLVTTLHTVLPEPTGPAAGRHPRAGSAVGGPGRDVRDRRRPARPTLRRRSRRDPGHPPRRPRPGARGPGGAQAGVRPRRAARSSSASASSAPARATRR